MFARHLPSILFYLCAMLELGQYQSLEILRETSVGLFLGNGEDEVLLPNKYCPEEYAIGDFLDVFVYLDYLERPIATNLTPKIQLHQFAQLKCVEVNDIGAFMDWGLEKHLFVPFREQRQKMQIGRWYMIYLDLDNKSQRLVGTNKIEKRMSNEVIEVKEMDEVDLIVYQKTDLGYNVVINHKHKGLVYENEVYETLRVGEELKGYIKQVREDNKIDVSLRPIGYLKAMDEYTERIYQSLLDADGFLPLNDKSDPDDISESLQMSKKAFKKAIGSLYKQRMISIEKDGIRIVDIS